MEISDLDRGKRREYGAQSGAMGAVDSENEKTVHVVTAAVRTL
jgi:hypothetical protein